MTENIATKLVNEMSIGIELISAGADLEIAGRWRSGASPYLLLKAPQLSTGEFLIAEIFERENSFFAVLGYPPTVVEDLEEIPYFFVQVMGRDRVKLATTEQFERLKINADMSKSAASAEQLALAESVFGSFPSWEEYNHLK